MTKFDEWWETECTKQEFQDYSRYGVSKVSFIGGMLAAADIAEYDDPDRPLEWRSDIAERIREEAAE